MSPPALRDLRLAAAAWTLFPPGALGDAIDRLGFVQADPIRAPARAQDLILRHRVDGYRAGDLERAYPDLSLIEDMVHVYGFLPRRHRALLHPRRIARRFLVEDEHPHLRRAILDHLNGGGAGHPRAIEAALALRYPRAALLNAWGGLSSATTRMLEALHYRGTLDVARRERGVRVFAPAAGQGGGLTPQQRADGLIALLVRLYAPLPTASLGQLTWMLGERALPRAALRARIPVLMRRGALGTTVVDGVEYVWPAAAPHDVAGSGESGRPAAPGPAEPMVRFLAPFDPLVWDRRRFALLWGWSYRFEAYVPAARRRLGYYALPLLWHTGDDARVVGWANVSRTPDAGLAVEAGYADVKPAGPAFRRAFDAEVARVETFLAPDEPDGVS